MEEARDRADTVSCHWFWVHVSGERMWFSGQGEIISLCHRCITLEYLRFSTRVAQLREFRARCAAREKTAAGVSARWNFAVTASEHVSKNFVVNVGF